MSPEQAALDRVGPESDWYAVGVLLYVALTGQLPFDGAAADVLMRKQRQTPPPPSALAPGVAPDLDALCCELLRIDPRQRPSGGEVLRRLSRQGDRRRSSWLPPPRERVSFVGRHREMRVLRDAFEAARSGTTVAVRVLGESGVGKSALVRQFSRVLADEGALLLTGRCHERELVSVQGVDGVVDALSQHLARLPDDAALSLLPDSAWLLPQLFPVLGRVDALSVVEGAARPALEPQEARALSFAALRELFVSVARVQPLVVVVDDLQWADADSLALHADLLRLPSHAPMFFLFTARADGATPRAAELPFATQDLALPSLTFDESVELASAVLAKTGTASARSPETIAREAQGHPLFVVELARHANTASPGDLRLDEALSSRVAQLDARARHVVELVSVAGAPLAIATAARALDERDRGELFVVRHHAPRREPRAHRAGRRLRPRRGVPRPRARGRAGATRPGHSQGLARTPRRLPRSRRRRRRRGVGHPLARRGGASRKPRAGPSKPPAKPRALSPSNAPHRSAAWPWRSCPPITKMRSARACPWAPRSPTRAADETQRRSTWRRRDTRHRQTRWTFTGAPRSSCFAPATSTKASTRWAASSTPWAAPATNAGGGPGFAAVEQGGTWPFADDGSELRFTPTTWRETICAASTLAGRSPSACRSSTSCAPPTSSPVPLRLALDVGEPKRLARSFAMAASFAAHEGAAAGGAFHSSCAKPSDWPTATTTSYTRAWLPLAQASLSFSTGRWRECVHASDEARQRFRSCTNVAWELASSQAFALYSLGFLGELEELSRRVDAAHKDAVDRGDLYAAMNVRTGSSHYVRLAADDPEASRRESSEALREAGPAGVFTCSTCSICSRRPRATFTSAMEPRQSRG